MFPTTIPVTKVSTLEGLAPLVTYEGKSIPSTHEVRVSHGKWKIKEQPGTGVSKSRDAHRSAAVDELKKLWNKSLTNRNCNHIGPDTLKAVLGDRPSIVRVAHLKTLQQVAALIDDLSKTYPKMQGAGAADLVAYVIGDAERREHLGFLNARLHAAAKIMETEGALTSPKDAYARAGIREEVQRVPSKPASSHGQSSSSRQDKLDAKSAGKQQIQWHASASSEPLDRRSAAAAVQPAPRQPAQQAGDSKGVDPQAVTRATRNCQAILMGAEPRSIAKNLTLDEKPVLLRMLADLMDKVSPHDQATETDKAKILRIANFLQVWREQKGAPTQASEHDLGVFTQAQRLSLARARELAVNKL